MSDGEIVDAELVDEVEEFDDKASASDISPMSTTDDNAISKEDKLRHEADEKLKDLDPTPTKGKYNTFLKRHNERRHLATLEDRARVWELHVKQGKSFPETAKIVGKSVITVRRYYYAKVQELYELASSPEERKAKKMYLERKALELLEGAVDQAGEDAQQGGVALRAMQFIADLNKLSDIKDGEGDAASEKEIVDVGARVRTVVGPGLAKRLDDILAIKDAAKK
jgi:hypothetical protein